MAEDRDEAPQGGEASSGDEMSEDEIDRNLMETFPASDPPSWTLGTDHREGPPDSSDTRERANPPAPSAGDTRCTA